MESKYFDIHIATNHIPQGLLDRLLHLGYTSKPIIRVDPRIETRILLSTKVGDKASADRLYALSVAAIESFPSFNGFIEEEAVIGDIDIESVNQPVPWGEFPEKMHVSPCAPGKHKKCDVHVITIEENDQLATKLLDAGFYYLSLDKLGVGPVHVYTILLEDIAKAEEVWKSLQTYLREGGNFKGSVKFEIIVNIQNFGFNLPPIVLKE